MSKIQAIIVEEVIQIYKIMSTHDNLKSCPGDVKEARFFDNRLNGISKVISEIKKSQTPHYQLMRIPFYALALAFEKNKIDLIGEEKGKKDFYVFEKNNKLMDEFVEHFQEVIAFFSEISQIFQKESKGIFEGIIDFEIPLTEIVAIARYIFINYFLLTNASVCKLDYEKIKKYQNCQLIWLEIQCKLLKFCQAQGMTHLRQWYQLRENNILFLDVVNINSNRRISGESDLFLDGFPIREVLERYKNLVSRLRLMEMESSLGRWIVEKVEKDKIIKKTYADLMEEGEKTDRQNVKNKEALHKKEEKSRKTVQERTWSEKQKRLEEKKKSPKDESDVMQTELTPEKPVDILNPVIASFYRDKLTKQEENENIKKLHDMLLDSKDIELTVTCNVFLGDAYSKIARSQLNLFYRRAKSSKKEKRLSADIQSLFDAMKALKVALMYYKKGRENLEKMLQKDESYIKLSYVVDVSIYTQCELLHCEETRYKKLKKRLQKSRRNAMLTMGDKWYAGKAEKSEFTEQRDALSKMLPEMTKIIKKWETQSAKNPVFLSDTIQAYTYTYEGLGKAPVGSSKLTQRKQKQSTYLALYDRLAVPPFLPEEFMGGEADDPAMLALMQYHLSHGSTMRPVTDSFAEEIARCPSGVL